MVFMNKNFMARVSEKAHDPFRYLVKYGDKSDFRWGDSNESGELRIKASSPPMKLEKEKEKGRNKREGTQSHFVPK